MPKPPKTADARAAEAAAIRRQLDTLGLPVDLIRPIEDALDHFETSGVGASGTIAVPGTPVVVVYLLSTQSHITSYVRITTRARR